jgi:hypothetical protein
MHNTYDPAKQSGELEFHKCMSDNCAICGPSGNTTLIDHNEKGILESHLQGVISMHQQAPLGSDHDSYKQGIYTTNSVGDND